MSEETENGYNPFSNLSVEKMLEKKKAKEHQRALLAEEIEEYKACLDRLFSSPDGKYFIKKLIRYVGLFSFDTKIDAGKLVEDAAKKKVYLELIRPYLSATTRMELENQ